LSKIKRKNLKNQFRSNFSIFWLEKNNKNYHLYKKNLIKKKFAEILAIF